MKTPLTNASRRQTTEQLLDGVWVCDPPPTTLLRYNTTQRYAMQVATFIIHETYTSHFRFLVLVFVIYRAAACNAVAVPSVRQMRVL